MIKKIEKIFKEAEILPEVIAGLTRAIIDLHIKQNELIDKINEIEGRK
jgi:hypothetical protein